LEESPKQNFMGISVLLDKGRRFWQGSYVSVSGLKSALIPNEFKTLAESGVTVRHAL
jgi:hypothetical protein